MMDLLKYLNARLAEPATWAAIATLLALLHVNIDPGLWHQITLWGSVVSGALGVLLTERGSVPTAQLMADTVNSFVTLVKAMPTQPPAQPGGGAATPPSAASRAAMLIIAGVACLAAWTLPAQASGTLPAMTPAQIVSDAQAAAKGLSAALAQAEQADPSLIPAATYAGLQTNLALAQGAAGTLSTSLSAPIAAGTVGQVEGYLNAVLDTLAAPPLNGVIPAPYNLAVSAAAVVVPELEAFVGTYVATPAGATLAPGRQVLVAPGASDLPSARQALARAIAGTL